MQDWPAWYIANVAIRVAAQASDSSSPWSGPTTTAALPPSSRVTCLRGTVSRIAQPTGTEPVKDTTGSRGSVTIAAATGFGTGSTDQDPAGSAVSASSSPRRSATSGVAGAGFTTMGAPTASAGATLCATRLSGKLNGAMPSTGPRGFRRTSASRPPAAGSVSSRCSVPDQRRASSAPQRNVETARVTSSRAHFSGLPDSAVISAATSSARSASRRDTWSRAPARTWAGVAANSARTASAAATASSTWAGVAVVVRPAVDPSCGERTSRTSSPVAARPATQYGMVLVTEASWGMSEPPVTVPDLPGRPALPIRPRPTARCSSPAVPERSDPRARRQAVTSCDPLSQPASSSM